MPRLIRNIDALVERIHNYLDALDAQGSVHIKGTISILPFDITVQMPKVTVTLVEPPFPVGDSFDPREPQDQK